ncbi:MAG: hypothetical protein WBD36_04345 [Bacteroidota bacterium]
MGKGQNTKRDSKKKPAKTMQEKKTAKREKKNEKMNIWNPQSVNSATMK